MQFAVYAAQLEFQVYFQLANDACWMKIKSNSQNNLNSL